MANKREDRFSQMMFGNQSKVSSYEDAESTPLSEESKEDSQDVMDQLLDIYSSIQNLKPILGEFSPIVEYIKKKFKS